MKNVCKDLKERTTKIINCEKLKMLPLTDEENELHKKQKLRYICRKKFSSMNKKYYNVPDHCHYTIKDRSADIPVT